ncbi:hypothetical protein [Frankia sp. Cas4]|uniref:hypothetical protein n=1 Tax=Frankia sp. Cas4 TaxID=3073927 RepID=UPI002AD43ABC|nr:hypothetical protein [Frankia sp. Cas4]
MASRRSGGTLVAAGRVGVTHRRPRGLAARTELSDRLRSVFPLDSGPLARPGNVVGVLAALVAGTLVSLARQGGIGALDTMWAEDGHIFLEQSVRLSVLDAFTTTYAGYLHVVPRTIAALAAVLPLRDAAAGFAVLSALLLAATAVFVYVASGATLRHRPVRLVLAASFVVLPVGQGEVLNNVAANLHFPLMAASVWALLWNPRGRAFSALAAGVVALAVLSDPTMILLAPVALLRGLLLRGVRGWAPGAVLLAGFVVQMIPRVTGNTDRAFEPLALSPLKIPVYYAHNVVAGGLFGDRLPGRSVTSPRAALFILLAVMVLGVFAALAWKRRRAPSSWLAMIMVGQSVLLYTGPVLLAGAATPRYALAPALILLSAAAVIVDRAVTDGDNLAVGEPRRAGFRQHAFVVLLVFAMATGFWMDNARGDGPRFSQELAAGRARCAALPASAAVTVRVSPSGWSANLPCQAVLDR